MGPIVIRGDNNEDRRTRTAPERGTSADEAIELFNRVLRRVARRWRDTGWRGRRTATVRPRRVADAVETDYANSRWWPRHALEEIRQAAGQPCV